MRTVLISISCLLATACASAPQQTVATVASPAGQAGLSKYSCAQLLKAQAGVDKTLKVYERTRSNFRSNLVVAYQSQQAGGENWGNTNSATNGADLTAGNIAYQISMLKGTQLEIFQAVNERKCAAEPAQASK
jgi:hypothetical protein